MLKVMIFIDGSWLYWQFKDLKRQLSEEEGVDYNKLRHVISEEITKQLTYPVDIVRTYLFGGYPENLNPLDQEIQDDQLDFYNMLVEKFNYEVKSFPIDYRGIRYHKEDRKPSDLSPEEKCVDVALATNMLYFAAIPFAYDIAVAITGDKDFIPVLQCVRQLGRRVVIVCTKGPQTAKEYKGEKEVYPLVSDLKTIFIEDIWDRIKLIYPLRQAVCRTCNKTKPTRYQGEVYFCKDCKKDFEDKKGAALARLDTLPETEGDKKVGAINYLHSSKKYGFVWTKASKSYYFDMRDLKSGVDFSSLKRWQIVTFHADKEPGDIEDKPAGKATQVKPFEGTS